MYDELKINAVILAGGFGTRLKSIVSDRPKVLAEVHGRPFITYLFDQLVNTCVQDVVLSTGYMADKITEKIGYNYRSLNLIYSYEDKPLGTGGALKLANKKCNSELLLVMNGDSYINGDLMAFVKWFIEKDFRAAIITKKVDDYSRFGRIVTDEKDLITGFEEKSSKKESGWINAGVYLFKKSILNLIPDECLFSLEHDFFPQLIKKSLYAYRCKEEFLDIGTPESYLSAEEFFKK